MTFGFKWKASFLGQTSMAPFWATLEKNLGYFLFHHLVTLVPGAHQLLLAAPERESERGGWSVCQDEECAMIDLDVLWLATKGRCQPLDNSINKSCECGLTSESNKRWMAGNEFVLIFSELYNLGTIKLQRLHENTQKWWKKLIHDLLYILVPFCVKDLNWELVLVHQQLFYFYLYPETSLTVSSECNCQAVVVAQAVRRVVAIFIPTITNQ